MTTLSLHDLCWLTLLDVRFDRYDVLLWGRRATVRMERVL